MKIILSRKGFDSEFGGTPSPIMPDGTLLSLPIPDKDDIIEYEQLQYNEKNYAQIIAELTNGKFSDKKCHLDPDIRKNVLTRSEKWRPAFGQSSGRVTHLLKENVGKDDLFLFFGWFREVEEVNGKYQYIKGSVGKHIIFGYLQVDEILQNPTKEQYAWLDMHPHLDRNSKKNAIFVARPTLSWNENKLGADCFIYEPELVLTKIGYTRSCWKLPDCLKEVEISYHSKASWKDNYFQSTGKGQEFVISADGNKEVEKWAMNLVNIGQKSTN